MSGRSLAGGRGQPVSAASDGDSPDVMRSLFFVPANRSDLIAKLPRLGADCSVLDLEDGTPPADKDRARANLADEVAGLRDAGHEARLVVRVNEPSSPFYLADLAAAAAADVDGIVVPKLEAGDQLFPALHAIAHGRSGARRKTIVAGIETMRGVLNAVALCGADPLVGAAYFGAEDFIADIGGVRSEKGDEVLFARSQVVLATRAAGIVPIDQAVADVRNDELYRADARAGRALGYGGKICVIPRQLALCHETFSPSPEVVEAARRLLAAFADAAARNVGTIEHDGKLIDGPMLRKARSIVAMSERIARAGDTR